MIALIFSKTAGLACQCCMGLTVTLLDPEGLSDIKLLSQIRTAQCTGHAVSMDSEILDHDPSWFQRVLMRLSRSGPTNQN